MPPCLFRTPLYVAGNFGYYTNLILWQAPYPGCMAFYGFEDGLFCPITWDLGGLL